MRYAIFTDIHANLEALEAVLAKIDELAQQQPIDQLWFLGDLVGYGPNPNECIDVLLKRTDVIIAGNHDWAAVGKIDVEDFSPAARISAEWTAEQLTEEHRNFLINLPERIQSGECTLVHGSPYGPLWEYLTSEVLAERSFQYYNTRYCFVGHTHVPVIYQQPDTFANAPTIPLDSTNIVPSANGDLDAEEEIETKKMVAVHQMNSAQITSDSAVTETVPEVDIADHHIQDHTQDTPGTNDTDTVDEDDETPTVDSEDDDEDSIDNEAETVPEIDRAEQPTEDGAEQNERAADVVLSEEVATSGTRDEEERKAESKTETNTTDDIEHDEQIIVDTEEVPEVIVPKETRSTDSTEGVTEDHFNSEIEELLTLLGLSQSMVQVTNEMIVPPEGEWHAPEGYRAIVNPGGVGQPRDGDPRAAFMIYDTEQGFTFYRVHYDIEKTQEKIIKAGLPQYLAARLSYGR